MLFTVYICGCHSLLSVNISAHEGSFGNLLRGAQAVVGIARCAHTSLAYVRVGETDAHGAFFCVA